MADYDPIPETDTRATAEQRMLRTGPLAVITGGTSGIGLELARLAAQDGYSILVAADRFTGDEATLGAVERVEADLATPEGVEALLEAIGKRPVAVLCANAGEGLGEGFLDQDFEGVQHMIDTNITGTLALVQQVGRRMRSVGQGRILFTGSIAGLAPATYQAAYGATKAFINSFAQALRQELANSGVSVTVLMPGATETRFFERAGMTDTRVAEGRKADPAAVAKTGWQAMKAGEDAVIAGAKNRVKGTLARFLPASLGAKRFGWLSEPGGADKGSAVPAALAVGAVLTLGAVALVRARGRNGRRDRAYRR
jgi:short-subunit dehydrogenase